MTTEIWGASYGINQAEDQINKNALAGLKAQEMLGDIAQQPAELRVKEAQARLFGAQAGKAEEEAKQSGAYQQFITKAMEDLAVPTQPGQPTTQSTAPLYNMGMLALKAGFPEQGMKLLKGATDIMQNEAAAGASKARTAVSQIEAQQKLIKGLAAETASITTPEQYAGWLATQVGKGRDMSFMPQSFDSNAKQMLNALTMQGIDADKQLELRRKALVDASNIKLNTAQEASARASAGAASARKDETKFDLTIKQKYAGPTADATLKSKKAATEASEQSAKASKTYQESSKRKQMLAESIRFKEPSPAQIENPNNFVDPLIDGRQYFIPGHGAMTWDAATQTMLPFIKEK